MEYGPQGIQPEGWVFEIREEVSIEPGEHGKGQGRKAGKGTSWKHRSVCQNCGTEFAGRAGAANRFCRNECQHEFAVNKWLSCSKCMAAVGIGTKTAARLLGISSANVSRKWKSLDIRPAKSNGLSIIQLSRMAVKREIGKPRRQEQKAFKAYRMARMRDIRECARGFDWSYLWTKEIATRASNAKYRSMSPDKRRERNALLTISKDPEIRRQNLNRWKARKRETDPLYRMIETFRSRLSLIAKGKTTKTKDLIGCSLGRFKAHIESMFTDGMTWDNYGLRWHVDHIMPCSAFDHSQPRQVAQCWHYTNLRPLDASENMKKSNIITNPQLSLMI